MLSHVLYPSRYKKTLLLLSCDVFHTDSFPKKSTPRASWLDVIKPKDGAEAAPWIGHEGLTALGVCEDERCCFVEL